MLLGVHNLYFTSVETSLKLGCGHECNQVYENENLFSGSSKLLVNDLW